MVSTAAPLAAGAARALGHALLAKGGPWLQRVGAFSALPALTRELGGDPQRLLASCGLASDALANPDARLPYETVVQLLHKGGELTGCEHFGLLAGRMWHLADLGLVGEIVANSATVGEALQTLTVYQHLNSSGGMAFLVSRGDRVELGYAIYHPGLVHTGPMYDALLAGGASFLRELCGPEWAPGDVFLNHARPLDGSHYRNLFRVQPHYEAESSALRFPTAWLTRRVEGSDPARLRDALRCAARIGRASLIQQVCRALRLLLLQGRNSGDEVAQMLSMHRRTLNRRLKAEGTTFQAVLDEVRFEVARELLASQAIPLDDISAALGYAGVGAFMRTFRRWTGTTPGQWRRNAPVPPPPPSRDRANASAAAPTLNR